MSAAVTLAAPAVESISLSIATLRDQRVILDVDLAAIYGVETKRLNEQIKRNAARFPQDFMFQLTTEESESLRSQFATLKTGRGQHRKYQSYVFTEHGADEDLRLRFEALAQLDSTERMVVKELLDGMLLKHQARRLAGVAA